MNTEIEKRRPAGVTVLAVLAITGSILSLLFGLLGALAPQMKPIALMLFTIYGSVAIWGFVNAFGLLRLKNWARISTIIFQTMPMLAFLGTFVVLPFANSLSNEKSMMPIVAAIIVLFIPGAISIWGIYYLNKKQVVAQFIKRDTPQAFLTERRPFLISAIAGFCIYGGIAPLFGLFQPHAILLGIVPLDGISAQIYYLAIGIVSFMSGWLMWRLRRLGLIVATCFFVYSMISSVLMIFMPNGQQAAYNAILMAQKNGPNALNLQLFMKDFMKAVAIGLCVYNAIILAILYWKQSSFTEPALTSSPET